MTTIAPQAPPAGPPAAQARRLTFRTVAYVTLVLFVFSIPWQSSIEVGGVGTISKLLGFVAVGVAAVAILFDGVRHRLIDVHVVMLAFVAWSICTVAWSLRPADSVSSAVTTGQLVVTALLVWEFADTPGRLRGIMRAFVAGGLVTATSVVVQYLATGPGASRYTGSGAHPNDVAFVLCLAIPFAWYLSVRTGRSWERLLGRTYIAFALYAVVLTASRSALVIAALALLIIPVSYPALQWRWRLGIAAAAVAGLLVVPALLPERQVDRLATISTELEGGDLSSRLDIWDAALEIMARHPLRGTGAGVGRYAIATVYGEVQGAHNTFLSVALERGAIGLALFLLLLYGVVRRGAQVAGMERGLIVVMSLCLAVGLLPRHWEDEKALWLVLAVLTAVGARRIGRAAPPAAGWPVAPVDVDATSGGYVDALAASAADGAEPGAQQRLREGP